MRKLGLVVTPLVIADELQDIFKGSLRIWQGSSHQHPGRREREREGWTILIYAAGAREIIGPVPPARGAAARPSLGAVHSGPEILHCSRRSKQKWPLIRQKIGAAPALQDASRGPGRWPSARLGLRQLRYALKLRIRNRSTSDNPSFDPL